MSSHSAAGGARWRVRIGPVYLDRVTLDEALDRFTGAIESRQPQQVVTVNLQFAGLANRNKAFRDVVNSADLVVPDGMPVIWLSKLTGSPLTQRITGHDLLHGCARLASARGYSIFLLGGTTDVAHAAMKHLAETFPGLKIAGSYQGMFTSEGYGASEAVEREALDAIRSARPDFLFVALGCPKQDFWIARHLRDIQVPVSIGVGGVLDVLSGNLKRAPSWMQRTGLEWSYRLKQEPGRLWKRYLLQDVPTVVGIGSSTLWRRAVPPSAGPLEESAGGATRN